MSSIYAFDFIFDGIPSHKFDLKIVTFDEGGVFSGVGSTDVEILTQQVYRKAKPYYLGRIQKPVLEFPLTFAATRPISALDRDLISAWLFGKSGYKKLEILQDDYNGAYFNCFMTKPEPVYIGNVNYAFKCQVICDSPFAYSFPKVVSYTNTNTYDYSITGADILYNYSSEDEYLYPILSFITPPTTSELFPCYVTFKNNTDDSTRQFKFENLYTPNMTITVDNDLQTVVTSASTLVLENFTQKNWFRLLPGKNSYTVVGRIANYSITYTERLKIGG